MHTKPVNVERWAELHSYAKQNRKKMTPAEVALWAFLRRGVIVKWYRQYVMGKYIMDFYCPTLRFAIEVDGGYHKNRSEYDRLRTDYLARHHGLTLIRFTNDDVLNNAKVVKKKIRLALMLFPEYRWRRGAYLYRMQEKKEYLEYCEAKNRAGKGTRQTQSAT